VSFAKTVHTCESARQYQAALTGPVITLGIKDAVALDAACVHCFGHALFGQALFLHRLGELSGEALLGDGFVQLVIGAIGDEQGIERGAGFGVHGDISFMGLSASSISSLGGFCVFLMNAWTTQISCCATKYKTLVVGLNDQSRQSNQ
jgi:hypothetical protein